MEWLNDNWPTLLLVAGMVAMHLFGHGHGGHGGHGRHQSQRQDGNEPEKPRESRRSDDGSA